MRVMRGPRLTALLVIVVAAVGSALIALPYVRGLSFLVRAGDMRGTIRTLADLDARRAIETEMDMDVPAGRSGKMSGRLYLPGGKPRRVILLVPGPHPGGISEPRLVRLARQLAASGLAVVTPDIPELSLLDISSKVTDEIEAVALWLSTRSAISQAVGGDRRVGLMGIGFSGGFSLVAAGRRSLDGHVAYVFASGGHDDLPRVLRYFCTGIEPAPRREVRLKPDATENDQVQLKPDEGSAVPPRADGVAVMLIGVADRVVPRPQVDRLRGAVRRFLSASSLDRTDKPQADREFASLKVLAKALPEPSATWLRYVNNRDVIHLGARLLPYIGVYGGAPSLSPSKSAKPAVPVFLLHGTDDLIPAIESEYLVNDLHGHAPVRLLLSGFLSRAEIDHSMPVGEMLNVASFWGDLLSR